MQTVQPSRLLKTVFVLDAAASGAIAAAHLLLPDALHDALGLPQALLAGTGIFLALYVALLLVLAHSRAVWHALALFVIVGNVGWAAASLALLAAGILAPSALGSAYVIAQAVGVLGFAVLEYRGLARSPVVKQGARRRWRNASSPERAPRSRAPVEGAPHLKRYSAVTRSERPCTSSMSCGITPPPNASNA